MPAAIEALRAQLEAQRAHQDSDDQQADQQSAVIDQRPAAIDRQASGSGRQQSDELPDGVLPPAGPLMGALMGLVGTAAAGEAAYNVYTGAHELLQLPLYMSLMAPLLFEAAASSFALQDLRDRRRGVHSRTMATWATGLIGLSAVVGALVGVFLYGPFGVFAGLASVVFGGMVHVHGARAIKAYQTRARESATWKAAEQARAEADSARDVLELLLPGDRDGKATVDLLKRRMDAGTLSPGDALIAAGWHRRGERGLTESQTIRIETVAATVWGADNVPAPPVAPSARRRTTTPPNTGPRRTATTAAGGATSPGTGAGGATSQDPADPVRRQRVSDEQLAGFVRDHIAANPDDGERPILRALSKAGFSGSVDRVRKALKTVKGTTGTTGTASSAGNGSTGGDTP
jgi:hypothetical protein